MKFSISSTAKSSRHVTLFEENNELRPPLLRLPPAWTQGGIRSRQGFCRSRADRENTGRRGGSPCAVPSPAPAGSGVASPRAGSHQPHRPSARHPSKGSACHGCHVAAVCPQGAAGRACKRSATPKECTPLPLGAHAGVLGLRGQQPHRPAPGLTGRQLPHLEGQTKTGESPGQDRRWSWGRMDGKLTAK